MENNLLLPDGIDKNDIFEKCSRCYFGGELTDPCDMCDYGGYSIGINNHGLYQWEVKACEVEVPKECTEKRKVKNHRWKNGT